uniref:hypothetical protein n=1 Tax=Caldicellulosiruptor changbaiensis TaxID=1222016 RepID=UPI0013DEEBDC|nr:hypothetical protein [Caldicellulosiruptor changbaiensis]
MKNKDNGKILQDPKKRKILKTSEDKKLCKHRTKIEKLFCKLEGEYNLIIRDMLIGY